MEFHEPAAATKTLSGKGKTKAKPAGQEESELLPLSPNGTSTPKTGKGSLWSTVYRSNGKAGPQDADPATGI